MRIEARVKDGTETLDNGMAAHLTGISYAERVRGTAGVMSAMASFALEIVDKRTAGTCQGPAAPRPAGAPLTEPVRPQNALLIRGRRKQMK